jgi:hypothetical protein
MLGAIKQRQCCISCSKSMGEPFHKSVQMFLSDQKMLQRVSFGRLGRDLLLLKVIQLVFIVFGGDC